MQALHRPFRLLRVLLKLPPIIGAIKNMLCLDVIITLWIKDVWNLEKAYDRVLVACVSYGHDELKSMKIMLYNFRGQSIYLSFHIYVYTYFYIKFCLFK